MREEVQKESEEPFSQDDKAASTLEEEIQAGEWQRLNEFPSFKRRSRQGRIVATYQAISNRLNQLVVLYYQFVRNHPEKAIRLLREIKRLRFLQEFLLNCLIWEEQGELEDREIPHELSELI